MFNLSSEQIQIFLGWIAGAASTIFGVRVLSRKDKTQEAKAEVGITDSNRLQAEIAYSKELAIEMRKLSEQVAGLQSSVLAIGTMLEAMVLCEECRRINAPFIRKISAQVYHHVPREQMPSDEAATMGEQVEKFFREHGYQAETNKKD